jgi:hypothetical protein
MIIFRIFDEVETISTGIGRSGEAKAWWKRYHVLSSVFHLCHVELCETDWELGELGHVSWCHGPVSGDGGEPFHCSAMNATSYRTLNRVTNSKQPDHL